MNKFLFLFLFSHFLIVRSQSIDIENKQDSLNSIPFKELNTLSIENERNGNPELALIYTYKLLELSKQQNDSLFIAIAFHGLISILNDTNAMQYADSMIIYSMNSTHKNFPIRGYSVKARLLHRQGKYSEALDNLFQAMQYAKKKKNKKYIRVIRRKIAAIKNVIGQYSEAHKIHVDAYNEIINEPNYQTGTLFKEYVFITYNLALSHLRLKKYDSAFYFSSIGIKACTKALDQKIIYHFQDRTLIHKFKGLQSTIDYRTGNYIRSRDSTLKILPYFEGNGLANRYYYLGCTYEKLGEKEKMIHAFKKADSVVTRINDPFPEMKYAYQVLIKNAIKNENQENQLKYIDKFIKTDSFMVSRNTFLSHKLNLEYDAPMLRIERENLNSRLKSINKKYVYAISFLGVFTIIILTLSIQNRKTKKRIKELMETPEQIFKSHETQAQTKITDKLVIDILKKIELFETERRYLDRSLTLNSLSKELNTNSSYLSSIINEYKQQNFASYIKELRIKNAVLELTNNPQYLKYSMLGIANEFGFNNSDSFSKAFQQITKIKPSLFIKEISAKI